MVTFKSDIASKKFNPPTTQFRELDVPDGDSDFNVNEQINSGQLRPLNMDQIAAFQARMNPNVSVEDDERQLEAEIQAARAEKAAKLAGKERLSEGARRRIEMLIGVTKSHRAVMINDTEYVFESLSAQATREVMLAASEYNNTVQFSFEMRTQILARSLVKIGGLEIDKFLGTHSLETRLAFVNQLDDALLLRLYNEYLELQKESRKLYEVNTVEEAKEVISDLKK